jgi:hypothetical protein
LNYNLVLDTYAKFFGSENLIIRSYDNLVVENGADLFEDIVSIILGKPSPLEGRRYLENAGFPPLVTEVIRILNSVLQRKLGLAPSSRIRECFVDKLDSFQKQMEALETRSARFLRSFAMSEPEQAFRRVQEHLLSKYPNVGPGVENGRLFSSQKATDYHYYSPELLVNSDCAEILQQLLHAVEQVLTGRDKRSKADDSAKSPEVAAADNEQIAANQPAAQAAAS